MSQHVIKNLEIKTATIEIKVIRVDGHKMTKATYDQILIDDHTEVDNSVIIGFIKENYNANYSILFNTNKGLRKRYLSSYFFYLSTKGNDAINRLKKEFRIDEIGLSDVQVQRLFNLTTLPEYYVMKYIADNKLDQLFIAT